MNKRINKIDIQEIEKKIGYTFKDKSLLIQAFTRTSFCNEQNPTNGAKYQSNEVLEFFGDGVLSVAIISFMLKECTERYAHGIRTELGEGDFSNIKSKLSDKQNLSKSTKALGLEKYLLMGEGDAKLGIENEPSVMEDLFESIVGAIYIDSDMDIGEVIRAVSTMLDMSVYTDRKKPVQSTKNALQEWCADKKHRLPPPRYETISEDGPDHKKTYMRACFIGERLMGRGVGKNFKIADAAAAEDALKALMTENSRVLQSNVDIKPQNKPDIKSQSVTAKKIKPKNAVMAESESKPIDTAKKDAKSEADSKKVSSLARLKAYASSGKLPSPTFRDLGETKVSGTAEYRVECSFSNGVTVGVGSTRSEAKEKATKMMIEKIGIGKKKKKAESASSTPTKKIGTDAPKKKKANPSSNAKSAVAAKKDSGTATRAKMSQRTSPRDKRKNKVARPSTIKAK